MRAQSKFPHPRTSRRNFAGVMWLVICALLTHSLDNCSAHLGGVWRLTSTPLQMEAPCPGGADSCEICLPSEPVHRDICDLLSEIAVLNSSSQQQLEIEPQPTVLVTLAVIPAIPQVIALSGCLHGRAEPPPTALASVFLRSSLPSRAPPVSA